MHGEHEPADEPSLLPSPYPPRCPWVPLRVVAVALMALLLAQPGLANGTAPGEAPPQAVSPEALPEAAPPVAAPAAAPEMQPKEDEALPPAAAPEMQPKEDEALDLAALEQRLRATGAIGFFTKLSLKNQVDDLIAQFRTHHRNGGSPTLAQLRQRFNLLLLKALSLLQDVDPALSRDIDRSRDGLWTLLADPDKFAKL